MKTNRFALLPLLISMGAASAFSAGSTFTATGVIEMLPTSMSDDATIVVGTGFFQVPNLYYTEADGASVIGDGCFNGLPSISGDGATVLGCHVHANGNENAARWLGGTSWQDLGSEAGAVPCGTSLSGPFGVNRDGSLGVGLLWRAQVCHANAGTWDLVNGGPAMVLPALFDGPASRANAVNADGSVIVGWQDQPAGDRTAAKWVNRLEELILTPGGGFNGEAHAVSADGNIIVGEGYDFSSSAWIWRSNKGVRPLGSTATASTSTNAPPPIPAFDVALDVSDNGKIVVGFERAQNDTRAVIWRVGKDRTFFLEDFIKSRGAVVPDGWILSVANVISADGKTIYGWGFNPDSQVEMYKVVLN